MNNLEIREKKMDWLTVINLALNKVGWGKTYTIYTCGNVTVTCKMKSFDFDRSIANFVITINYVYNDIKRTDTEYAEFFMNNYDLLTFENLIQKKILKSLKYIIYSRTKEEAEHIYIDKYVCSDEIDEDKCKELGYGSDYNEIMNISNDDIRKNALIELQELLQYDLNIDYRDCISDYTNNNEVDMPNIKKLIDLVKINV